MNPVLTSVLFATLYFSGGVAGHPSDVFGVEIRHLNFFIEYPPTNRTWQGCLDFCKGRGAGIGRVVKQTDYTTLLKILPKGTYWIDGKDKSTADRFTFDETCLVATGVTLEVTGAYLPPVSCLALARGETIEESGIFAQSCNMEFIPLCFLPTDDDSKCKGEEGTPTKF